MQSLYINTYVLHISVDHSEVLVLDLDPHPLYMYVRTHYILIIIFIVVMIDPTHSICMYVHIIY